MDQDPNLRTHCLYQNELRASSYIRTYYMETISSQIRDLILYRLCSYLKLWSLLLLLHLQVSLLLLLLHEQPLLLLDVLLLIHHPYKTVSLLLLTDSTVDSGLSLTYGLMSLHQQRLVVSYNLKYFYQTQALDNLLIFIKLPDFIDFIDCCF